MHASANRHIRHQLCLIKLVIASCPGILRMYEDILLRLDFIHLAQFLTRLPDNVSCLKLFDCISQIRMVTSDKQPFSQVFVSFREQLCR